MPRKLWFKAKRYGWGWQPATIEGWLCLGMWFVVTLGWSIRVEYMYLADKETLVKILPVSALTTAMLILVCMLNGERPSWRWGDKL